MFLSLNATCVAYSYFEFQNAGTERAGKIRTFTNYVIAFQIVQQCNEAARRVEQREKFQRTWEKLEFPSTVPSTNPEQSQLVRSGEITQLVSRGEDTKLTFGKRFIKIHLHLFLFNDLFVVCKRKG